MDPSDRVDSITEDELAQVIEAARSLLEETPAGFTTKEFVDRYPGLDRYHVNHIMRARRILARMKALGIIEPVRVNRTNIVDVVTPVPGWRLAQSG